MDKSTAPTCTCPSGDGSLRWPCPAHRDECTNASANERVRDFVERFFAHRPYSAENVVEAICAALSEQPATPAPVQVPWPQSVTVEASAWEAAAFHFGGPGTSEDGEYLDCTLWVGEIDNEEGEPKVFGLHIMCNECPEEGSITIAELPRQAPTESYPAPGLQTASLDELMQHAASNHPLVALVHALDKAAPGFKGVLPKLAAALYPQPAAADDAVRRIADFLNERDEALEPGEASDVEREESAREIVAMLSASQEGGR